MGGDSAADFWNQSKPFQAFHYTQSDARKAWTKMVYPYAPYFFNMFREIPWDSWRFEDDDFSAHCNPITPYVIIGGAACELLDKVYGPQLPERGRLHTNTDPTGDIDVLMPGIIVEPKKAAGKRKLSPRYTYFTDHKGTMQPYTRSYTIWLLNQIESYFKKLSYNFAEWFPTATDFVYAADAEAMYAESATARRVGPFHIYLSIFPQPVGEEATMKIQVSMAHKYEGQVDHEHFIEFLLSWEEPVDFVLAYPHIKLDPLGLIVCQPQGELRRNEDGIRNRISFVDQERYVHKVKNHFGRAIFLINLLNLPHFYDELPDRLRRAVALHYRNSVALAAEKDESIEDAIKMLKACPRRFKERDEVYTSYKQLCEDEFDMSLEECGLPAEAMEAPRSPATMRAAKRARTKGKFGGGGRTRRLWRKNSRKN